MRAVLRRYRLMASRPAQDGLGCFYIQSAGMNFAPHSDNRRFAWWFALEDRSYCVTEIRRTSSNSIAVWVLLVLCGGCGPSVPDGGVGVSSPSMVGTGHVERTGNPNLPLIGSAARSTATLERSATPERAEDPRLPSDSSIPQTISNDLTSPDARVRYRALDHWEDKDTKAPLDPVFEAMEDEDPAVRAKATAIVEKQWEAEQEQENRRRLK